MITLNDITLRRGLKILLEHASATIHAGEKVGLVGHNGSGKSTLFALLTGGLHEDNGDFSLPAAWRIAQVAQEMPDSTVTSTDFVLAGDAPLVALNAALAHAEAAGDGMAIARAHTALADAGAYDARARAEALILGLGFSAAGLSEPVNSFSGGWRMRLQLARALMAPSDLLLLDEPTNHLDLDALIWLESWLARYPGTLITISHDREFLDAVTRVTLHIDGQHLKRYTGNYSAFERIRAEQLSNQQANYAKQQEKRAHLEKFISRFKAKATKARQAQSRVKALERMEQIAPVLAEAEFQFSFEAPQSLPNPMLVMDGAVLGYRAADPDAGDAADASTTGADHVVLRGVSRTVLARQRIGILGANGQGKSTWVKTVAGLIPLLAGHVTRGQGLAIGYFAQRELDVLRAADSPLQHMVHLARTLGLQDSEAAREQNLRNFLGGFHFSGDMVRQAVGEFSGGEKARLALAMIVWQRPNLLLLDEPTNHLDLATREALAVALNDFDGTLLLVSHDRALLRSVCDEFWLVADGAVRDFDGDLDDYRDYLLEHARSVRGAAAASSSATASAGATATSNDSAATPAPTAANRADERRAQAQARQRLAQQTRPLRRELDQIDQRLDAANARKTELEQQMLQPLPPDALADAGREHKRLSEEIDTLEERWLELSEQVEALR